MPGSTNDGRSWRAVQVHAAGHVIGATMFAALALGAGLVLGGFVSSPDRCVPVPVELLASR
jgi:hypothetical protein